MSYSDADPTGATGTTFTITVNWDDGTSTTYTGVKNHNGGRDGWLEFTGTKSGDADPEEHHINLSKVKSWTKK